MNEFVTEHDNTRASPFPAQFESDGSEMFGHLREDATCSVHAARVEYVVETILIQQLHRLLRSTCVHLAHTLQSAVTD